MTERESFVFYRSFATNIRKIPAHDRLIAYESLVSCALGDNDSDELPYPLNAIIGQMLESVNAAHRRHDEAVKNGKKGSREPKRIDQEEAERLYAELGTWDKVAKTLKVDPKTLRAKRDEWEREKNGKGENGKNLNNNVTVTVNDNETVTGNIPVPASAERSQSDTPRRETDYERLLLEEERRRADAGLEHNTS